MTNEELLMKKNSRKYAPLRTKSLLSKTLTLFLSYTTGIFLLTAPLFYLLTKYFYAEDMIDVIQSVKSGHGLPLIDIESDIMEGMILQFILIFLVIGSPYSSPFVSSPPAYGAPSMTPCKTQSDSTWLKAMCLISQKPTYENSLASTARWRS